MLGTLLWTRVIMANPRPPPLPPTADTPIARPLHHTAAVQHVYLVKHTALHRKHHLCRADGSHVQPDLHVLGAQSAIIWQANFPRQPLDNVPSGIGWCALMPWLPFCMHVLPSSFNS